MAEKRKDSKGRNLRTGESERKDGRYMYRWMKDGKSRSVYAQTLGELREKEEQIKADIREGIDSRAAKTTTINDVYDKWIENRVGLRNHTLATYKRTYEHHVRNAIGKRKIADVKYSDMKAYFVSLSKEKGYEKMYLASVKTVLTQVFEVAERDGIIRKNPCNMAFRDASKECYRGQKKRRSLTIQEQTAFLDFIENHPIFDRWKPIFTILFGTGCRIGEVVGLQWSDCDFKTGIITIRRTATYYSLDGKCLWDIHEPKTEAGIRTVPMLKEVKEALLVEKEHQKEWDIEQPDIDGYNDFVFVTTNGKPYNANAINKVIERICRYYNEDEEVIAADEGRKPLLIERFSVHNIRHTFASRLCENVTNLKAIQEIMGHANIETTMNIYADATAESKKKSMESLDGKIFREKLGKEDKEG